ncbi:MAG: hypothetical protein ACYC3H_08425 [Bellilinea sp.]
MEDRIMAEKHYNAEKIFYVLEQAELIVSHIVPMSFGNDKQP